MKGGLKALKGARAYYKRAAKTNAKHEEKWAEEDTEEAEEHMGSSGKDVVSLMEDISSDFKRILKETEEGEKEAQNDYAKLSRDMKSDIKGKETKIELSTADIRKTKTTLFKSNADLDTTNNLLDDAKKTNCDFAAHVRRPDEQLRHEDG